MSILFYSNPPAGRAGNLLYFPWKFCRICRLSIRIRFFLWILQVNMFNIVHENLVRHLATHINKWTYSYEWHKMFVLEIIYSEFSYNSISYCLLIREIKRILKFFVQLFRCPGQRSSVQYIVYYLCKPLLLKVNM